MLTGINDQYASTLYQGATDVVIMEKIQLLQTACHLAEANGYRETARALTRALAYLLEEVGQNKEDRQSSVVAANANCAPRGRR